MGFKSSFEFILASFVHPYCSWYSSLHLGSFCIICPSIIPMILNFSFEFISASFVHQYCTWDSSLHLSSFWQHLSIHIAHDIRVISGVYFGIICPSILLMGFKSSFEFILASFVHPYCSWDSSLHLSSFWYHLSMHIAHEIQVFIWVHLSSFLHHLSINIVHGIQVFIWVHFGIICRSILPMEFKSSSVFIWVYFGIICPSILLMIFNTSFEFILESFVHPYCSWYSSLHLSSFEFILASFVHQYCSWDSSLHLSAFWHHSSIHIAHGIRLYIWVHFGIICSSICLMGFKSSFEFILASFDHPNCSWYSSLHLSLFWHHLSIHIAHRIQVFIWVHFGIICPSILLMGFDSSFEFILASFVHPYCSWDSSLHLSSFWHHLNIHIAHGIQVFIWVHFGIICPSILLMIFESSFEFILASFVHPYCSWDSSLHLSLFWHHLSIHIAHGIQVFIWVHFGIICPSVLLMGFDSSFWHHLSIHIAHGIQVFIWVHLGIIWPSILLVGFKSSFEFILASFVHPYCSWESTPHLSSFWHHLSIHIAYGIQVFIWVHFGIIWPSKLLMIFESSFEFILASFVHPYCSCDSTLHLSSFWHHLSFHIAHGIQVFIWVHFGIIWPIHIAHGIQVFIWVHFGIICPSILLMIFESSFEFILASFVHPYCSWDSSLHLSSFWHHLTIQIAHNIRVFIWVYFGIICPSILLIGFKSSFEFILASFVHPYCSWDSTLHLSSFWHHLSIHIAHGIQVFIWVHFGIIWTSILFMGFKSSFEFISASFVHPYCSWYLSLHLSSFWHHLSIHIAHGIQVFIWVYFGIICPSILLMGFKSSFEFILASFVHPYCSWESTLHFGIICPSILLMGFKSSFESILASFDHLYCSWDSSLHLSSFWHHLSIHIAHGNRLYIWVHFGIICPSILLMGFKSSFEFILASFVHPYCSCDSTLHLSSFWHHLSIHIAHGIQVFIWDHFGIIWPSILLMGFKSSFEFILASFVHPYCSWYLSLHLSSFWHHLSIHIAHGIQVFIWVHFGIICPSILLMGFKSSFEFILASFIHPYCSWDSSLHLSSFWQHLSTHIAHGIRVFIWVHFGIICTSKLLMRFKSSFEFILASFDHPNCSWYSSLHLSPFWHHLSIHIAHRIQVFIWVHFGIIWTSILLMGFKSSFEFILASFVHPYCSWYLSLHLSSFWHHLSIHIAHGIRLFIWVHFGIICPSILLMGFKSSFEFILASFDHPNCSWYSSYSFEFILASFVHPYCSSDSSLHLSSFWHHLNIHIAHGIQVFIWVHFGIICPSILLMIFESSFEFILASFVHPYCSWVSTLHLTSFWHHLSIHIAHGIQVFIWVHFGIIWPSILLMGFKSSFESILASFVHPYCSWYLSLHLSSFWHHLSIHIAHGIQVFIWVHFGSICPPILLMGYESSFEFILASFVHPYCSWDSFLHLSSFWHHLSIHIAHGIRVFIWVYFGIICPSLLLMGFKSSFEFILASFVHPYCSWYSSFHLSSFWHHLYIQIAHEIQVFIWVHFGIIWPSKLLMIFESSFEFILASFVHPYFSSDSSLHLSSFWHHLSIHIAHDIQVFIWVHFGIIWTSILLMGFKFSFEFILASFVHPYCSWYLSLHLSSFWHHLSIHIAHGIQVFIWVYFGIICPSILLMGFKSSFEFILASFVHPYCSWDSTLHFGIICPSILLMGFDSSFEFILASFDHPYCSWDSSLHLSSFWHHLTIHIAHGIQVFIWVHFGIICPSILLMIFESSFLFILASFVHPYCSWDSSLHLSSFWHHLSIHIAHGIQVIIWVHFGIICPSILLMGFESSFEFILAAFVHPYRSWDTSLHLSSFWHHLSIHIAHGIQVFIWVHFGIICPSILLMVFESSFELFWHHLSIHIAHGIQIFIWVHFGIICPCILLMIFKFSFEFILASFVHPNCSWDSSLHLSSFEIIWVHFGIICPSILLMGFKSPFVFILASFVHPYCSWDSSLHLCSFWQQLSIQIAHDIRVFIWV